MYFEETEWKNERELHRFFEDGDEWQAFVKTVMNPRLHKMW